MLEKIEDKRRDKGGGAQAPAGHLNSLGFNRGLDLKRSSREKQIQPVQQIQELPNPKLSAGIRFSISDISYIILIKKNKAHCSIKFNKKRSRDGPAGHQ